MTWGHDNLGNPYSFRQRRAVQWAKFCVWFESWSGVDLWR